MQVEMKLWFGILYPAERRLYAIPGTFYWFLHLIVLLFHNAWGIGR